MYLNIARIAESFGVPERVVENWIRNDGLPHTLDRGRLLFDRAQVANWAVTRGLAMRSGFLAPKLTAVTAGWRLATLLRAGGIWREIPPAAVPEVFRQIVTSLRGATPAMRELLAQRLQAPGGVALAPVGGGFALPHPSARISLGRESGVMAVVGLRSGLLPAEPVPDDVPITRLVFFVAPSPRAHLDLLGRLSRVVARGPVRDVILRMGTDEEIFRATEAAEAAEPRNRGEEGGS